MQPMKQLQLFLDQNATADRYLFTLNDLRSLFPDSSYSVVKTLLSRAVSAGYLDRPCRGIYLSKKMMPNSGFLLFHVASLLRANDFNYISFETVLSEFGVISQVPLNWVSIMSSGRSNIIKCGNYGTIEFVHTKQNPSNVMSELTYDQNCRLWRASVGQALRDMREGQRNCDLIDWEIANEFI